MPPAFLCAAGFAYHTEDASNMSNLLQDKVTVVTGGTSGIGLGIAKRFASEGAFVYITGRRQSHIDSAVATIGDCATGVRCDSSSLADLDALYQRIESDRRHVDVLVANAGIGELAPLGSITEEHFDKTFSTNVKGVLFTVQKALPLLCSGASVILVASTTSTKGSPTFSVYGATKAAVRNFARSWIQELKGRDIRVNVLSPGPIRTPGLAGLADGPEEAFFERRALSVPMGRLGDPDEIGKAAIFLASDASSFVNGAELFVDGGEAQI
jgi:NAD(P)-dependent dehydrogenase (short-subunit alcohol dehydrogenase family)